MKKPAIWSANPMLRKVIYFVVVAVAVISAGPRLIDFAVKILQAIKGLITEG